jgi:adenylylsulfate kinase
MSSDLYPTFERLVPREAKEQRLGQRGRVLWLFGLSGSGKSTLAAGLERRLHQAGKLTAVLDGDNIRSRLNRDLGFGDEARAENIRRVAEVARLFTHNGLITLVSFITPTRALRDQARAIVGAEDWMSVYVRASYATCAARDPKGLYARVAKGEVAQFTGKDSGFEEPAPGEVDVVIDTEGQPVETAVELLFKHLVKSN